MIDLNDIKLGDTVRHHVAHYPDETTLHITKESETAFSVRVGVSSQEHKDIDRHNLNDIISKAEGKS